MNTFNKVASKVVDQIEALAEIIYNDENVKEFFIESYDYLDGDDATHVAFLYIEDTFFG